MQDIDPVIQLLNEDIAAIPVKKSKAPDLPKGSQYFKKRISEEKAKEVFNGSYGVGIKCGQISEGIECIDFDDHDGKHGIKKVFNKFTRHEFIMHLWQSGKAFIQQTPSGGFHFIYRYEAKNYEGSQPLARWEDGEVMVETRGEGGYFVCCPTPEYKPLHGELEKLETLEKWERDNIIELCREFDQSEKTEKDSKDNTIGKTEKTDPVTFFNANKIAFAKHVLEESGWTKKSEHDGIEYWTRPGKETQDGPSATWGHISGMFYVFSSNAENFQQHCYYTPFQILLKLKYEGKYKAALSFIEEKYGFRQDQEEGGGIQYIRVGVNYYKVIYKTDRYGIKRKELKLWSKEEIRQDHNKDLLKQIPKFDDFTIEPNNFNYRAVIENCYNLYKEFPFKPKEGKWPWTEVLLKHIFGEQYEIGLKYLQAMYLHPKHILPILALLSKIRGTGKTTFVNWYSMLFGDNMAIISPEDLQSGFNFSYATKNVICIEETTIEKAAPTEKLKAISTGKHISVNQKFVNSYKLPLYSKVVITSNNEDRFLKIDEQEIRYFVRKLTKPQINNANIEDYLINEIPAFLHYLTQMPALDFSKSRMLFTPGELKNDQLTHVKEESKTSLYKDIRERMADLFYNTDAKKIYAVPSDIKEAWFYNNSRVDVNYIRRVLKEEYNMEPNNPTKYRPLGKIEADRNGRPYEFHRGHFVEVKEQWEDETEPF